MKYTLAPLAVPYLTEPMIVPSSCTCTIIFTPHRTVMIHTDLEESCIVSEKDIRVFLAPRLGD